MNRDFVEMLSALSAAGARFLIVGAHALAAHGVARATGDLDIWIRATPDNAARVYEALQRFGAALFDLSVDDLSAPDTVFQIGIPPSRIDILSGISGMTFDQAWPNRMEIDIGGLRIGVIGREDFIANKRATGRPKDLMDLTLLQTETDGQRD
jgi:predicted nucleotidyltransferase